MLKLVKLITGEEVIADQIKNGNEVTLKNPVRIIMTPDGSAGMMPLLALSKNDQISVLSTNIMYTVEPDDELVNVYNARFGSGIVMPPSGLTIIDN